MSTCIDCKHWNPKATDANMLRFGYARCDMKKLPGHTTSARAEECGQFAALEAGKGKARTDWLAKQEAKR